MTPPPVPPEQAKKWEGSPSSWPSQSIMTTSKSVQAGLAIFRTVWYDTLSNRCTYMVFWKQQFTQENPMQPIASLNMSARIAGHELPVGKYAWKCGECQWVTYTFYNYEYFIWFIRGSRYGKTYPGHNNSFDVLENVFPWLSLLRRRSGNHLADVAGLDRRQNTPT